jgi:hypothetical protein
MDEDDIRRIIREEISLAFTTLYDMAYRSDDDDPDVYRAMGYFNSHAYQGAYEAADADRNRHEHDYRWADDGTGHSGSFCIVCGDPEPEPGEALVRKASRLPAADMDALDPDVRDALRHMDPAVRDAMVRVLQHQTRRTPAPEPENPFRTYGR